MSDLITSPPTESPARPAAPPAFEAGDIDIELLLDQAQALVDDTADQFSDPPLAPASRTAEPAAMSDISVSPEIPPADLIEPPASEPAVTEQAPEFVEVAVTSDGVPSPSDLAEARIESPPPEQPKAVAPSLVETPSPVAEAAPAQPDQIIVEDFGMPSAPGAEPAAQSPSASPGPATITPQQSNTAPAPLPTPPRATARPLRIIAACVLLLDRPFSRLSEHARRRVGWIAIATFLMGTVAWLLPLFRASLPIHK